MIDLAIVALLIVVAFLATTVVVIFPPASLTLVVTACGILLLWRFQRSQTRLAERKLFLDLMPRRAEWYDRIKLALKGREIERLEHVELLLRNEVPPNPEHLSKLWQLETEAGWLFSMDMVALTARLIEADKHIYEMQLEARYGNMQAALEVGRLHTVLHAEQRKLQDYLVSYLYVGDIGKPRRSPIKFANVKPKWRSFFGL